MTDLRCAFGSESFHIGGPWRLTFENWKVVGKDGDGTHRLQPPELGVCEKHYKETLLNKITDKKDKKVRKALKEAKQEILEDFKELLEEGYLAEGYEEVEATRTI